MYKIKSRLHSIVLGISNIDRYLTKSYNMKFKKMMINEFIRELSCEMLYVNIKAFCFSYG